MQDGFADEHTIYGGYNQSSLTSSGENGPGIMRLLDNFTFYVQTDDEGSEELVDLQDFTTGVVHCIAPKVDTRTCLQQAISVMQQGVSLPPTTIVPAQKTDHLSSNLLHMSTWAPMLE